MLARGAIGWLMAAGSAALVLSAAVPLPLGPGDSVDPRTGELRPSAWALLAAARAGGDAAAALWRLRSEPRLASEPVLQRVADLLQRELSEPGEVAPFRDPTRAGIEALFAGSAGAAGPDARADALLRDLRRHRPVPPEALLRLADRFAAAARPRAHLRWLLRAARRSPAAAAIAGRLAAFYTARGRLREALAATDAAAAAGAGGVSFWRRRAELSAWLSRGHEEAAALERVLQFGEDLAARRRLLDLYVYLGQADRGVPHAKVLAEKAGELAAAEEAVHRELAAGRTERALRLLEQLAAESADPVPWDVRAARYALQDLQVGRAEAYLRRLIEEDPGGGHDVELEALYRRRDRPAELAELLAWRARQKITDRGLWDEVVALCYGLGNADKARELQAERDLALLDPASFRQQLAPSEQRRLAELRRRALSLAFADNPDRGIVGQVLGELRPYLDRPGFRAVAESLLRRFPNDPQARELRIELLDRGRTPAQAARAAAELAATYPDDVEVVRLWVERTAWADLVDEQVQARQALLRLDPDDAANRRELADLYEFRRDNALALQQWRWLVARGGLESEAVPRLIESLFANGEEDEALEWLRRLAEAPSATLDNKLAAAEQLFFRKAYDQAQVLYRAILDVDAAHARALLRLGQILCWTNDPRGALPYLRRRLQALPETGDEDRALALFQIGEALWALGEDAEAAAFHRQALARMQTAPAADFDRRSMVATMLARLGRREEALPIYRELVEQRPRNIDLVLDFSEVLADGGELRAAEALLRHAAGIDPDHERLLRARGQLLLRLSDYTGAAEVLGRALELHGPDAGLYADRGQAQQQAGDWEGALASLSRWATLQADSVAARRAAAEMRDRLSSQALPTLLYLDVGEDRTWELAVEGSVRLDPDRSWLKARAGYGRYQGRAAAFQNGTADLVTEVGLFDLAYERRVGVADRIAAGLELAAGAPGAADAGGWAGVFWQRPEPYASLELRLFANELLTQPAAAAGLAGRAHGLRVQAYSELGSRFWAGTDLRLSAWHVDPRAAPAATDGHFAGELSLGYRLIEGDIAVPDRFRIRRTPSGPSVLFLDAEPDQTRDLLLNTWVGFQSYRLLDDQDLAGMLPIAPHAEYVIGAARLDKHLARGLGVSAEAYLGAEFAQSSSIWGVEVALNWRPRPGFELTFGGGRGAVLGRSGDDDDSEQLRLQAVLRW